VASPYQLFQRAERVERLCSLVYLTLAERFRHDAEACALFTRLAAEEEQHANRVRLVAAHYRNDPKLPICADLGGLEACAAECEQAVAEIQAGSWGTDLDEVRRRVFDIEIHMAQAHADLLARNASPELREFLAQLAQQDDAHARFVTGDPRPAQLQIGNRIGDRDGALEETRSGVVGVASGVWRGRRPQ
jgi:hypothetical protein